MTYKESFSLDNFGGFLKRHFDSFTARHFGFYMEISVSFFIFSITQNDVNLTFKFFLYSLWLIRWYMKILSLEARQSQLRLIKHVEVTWDIKRVSPLIK